MKDENQDPVSGELLQDAGKKPAGLIINPGHHYALPNFVDGKMAQEIKFIHKTQDGDGEDLALVHDGTTNESLLQVLIHRMHILDSKFPSEYNKSCILKLKGALLDLENRTANRVSRNVEGKHLS